MSDTTRPDILTGRGADLWDSLTQEFDFGAHDQSLLIEACRTLTLIDDLDERLQTVGVTVAGRANPLLAEIRQQRLVFARTIAALRIPDDDGNRPQNHVGVRGTYGMAG